MWQLKKIFKNLQLQKVSNGHGEEEVQRKYPLIPETTVHCHIFPARIFTLDFSIAVIMTYIQIYVQLFPYNMTEDFWI